MFCREEDKYNPRRPEEKQWKLRAAGGKSASATHAHEFTADLRLQAGMLGDSRVLAQLCSDVRASELFYHLPCLSDFNYKYTQTIAALEEATVVYTDTDEFIKFGAHEAVRRFINESTARSFTSSELESIYQIKFQELGGPPKISHSTRFTKDYLEKRKDDLRITIVQKSANSSYTILRQDNLEAALVPSDWCTLLRRVTDPIRQEIVERPVISEMADLEIGEDISIRKIRMLITLLCQNEPSFQDIPKALETICQLIAMQTKKFVRPGRASHSDEKSVQRRIPRKSEVPVARYFTLKIYATIRSRELISCLAENGITVSYYRLLEFTSNLNAVMIELYSRSGDRVLPSLLRIGVFTVFIDDNLDQNSSSSTAVKHFHGSSVTEIQFPEEENPGEIREKKKYHELTDTEKNTKFCPALEKYLNVDDNVKINKKNISSRIQTVCYDEDMEQSMSQCYKEQFSEEKGWCNLVTDHIQSPSIAEPVSSDVSWTGFHLHKCRDQTGKETTLNSMLPVIDHVVHDAAFQYHVLCISQDYTAYLNPGQTTVSCGDQPLYALKKLLIWANPNRFLKPFTFTPDVFAFFGPLHIEQVSLVCTGELIRATGLEDILSTSGLSTVGLSTAMCDVNNIKKARYCGQVVAPVLNTLLMDAYKEARAAGDKSDDFDEWCKEQKDESFIYFSGILKHLLNINLFVRSLREASFDLFITSLEQLCPLLFALDHIHYSRWIPVFNVHP